MAVIRLFGLGLLAIYISYIVDMSYVEHQDASMRSDASATPTRVLCVAPLKNRAHLAVELPESAEVVFEDAIDKLRPGIAAGQFEMVIVDVGVPNLSGEDLVRFIRSCSSSTVVVVSTEETGGGRPMLLRESAVSLQRTIAGILGRFEKSHRRHKVAGNHSERTDDERSALRRRVLEASFKEREDILKDALSTQEVADLLGVTRQTPHDRVKRRALLAIEDKGTLRFPHWQFDASGPNGVVPGLAEVLAALNVGALAQARWLTRKSPGLEGRTPMQALRDGDIESVLSEARGIGAEAG